MNIMLPWYYNCQNIVGNLHQDILFQGFNIQFIIEIKYSWAFNSYLLEKSTGPESKMIDSNLVFY